MESFNNQKKVKNELLKILKHHQELDTFIQGDWLTDKKVKGNGYKGCFYGCTMQTKDNPINKFSEKYNIDLWYCYLTEKIFEGLPDGEYQKFPYESINIIPIGFDFNKIKSIFLQNILKKQLEWVDDNKVIIAINQCIELFNTSFNEINRSAARSAESAARSAAESAAESAAWSAARSAWSAARSARSAVWSARSAESAESAARSAVCSKHLSSNNYYVWMKDMLFNLIKNS